MWKLNYSLSSKFQLDMVRCLWALLPASILWEQVSLWLWLRWLPVSVMPAALLAAFMRRIRLAPSLAPLFASLAFVSWFGMQHTQQGLIGVSAISGLLMLALAPAGGETAKAKLNFALTVLFAMVISGLLVVTVPELNKDFVAYGRFSPVRAGRSEVIYVGEGRMGLVAVSKLTDGTLNYHNAGKIQASSDPADMRLQRMLGHLTTLVPKTQKNFPRDRVWRRRDCRRCQYRAQARSGDDRGDRAARSRVRVEILRRSQLQGRGESQG
jgi:spermidine synthase